MKMDYERATAVAEKYKKQILALPGVVGISTGVRRESGEAYFCIKVYLSKPVERGELDDKRIPWRLEGVPVDIIVTGEIIALGNHS